MKEKNRNKFARNDKRIKSLPLGIDRCRAAADLRSFHIRRTCDTNLSASVCSSDHLLASRLIRGPPMKNQLSSGIIRFSVGGCANEDRNDMDAAATRSMPSSRQLHSISIQMRRRSTSADCRSDIKINSQIVQLKQIFRFP